MRPPRVAGHITAGMAAEKNFTFICGSDDFLVGRLGQQRFDALAADVADEFSREIINGFAGNVGEVEAAVNRFRESVQTVSMFGGKRVVWFKDLNFLADTVTGRAESTLKLVEDLQQLLAALNPAESAVLVTAAPIDRRRSFPKWCEKNADFTLVGGDDGDGSALEGVILAEAKLVGATFSPDAMRLLLAKVGANTRLLVEEVHKLATYVGEGERIEDKHVAELTPNVAEGDFFEAAESFFSGDLQWTLAALQRHFFAGGDARPVISALQNRNRILLQVRALVDAGDVRIGQRGLEGFPKAQAAHAAKFIGVTEKSSYNVFTQNPWYLGKLAGSAKLPSLRRLIDNQQEFIGAFEEIIRRPHEQEEVLREMTVRCLAAA
ncbi:MAG: polymerase delta subunit [Verrucomicrobia bacterium]|nr:polymerase delta subunit [Verrucomicrobiota bacterium]